METRSPTGDAGGGAGGTAVLFPGQGAQEVGMGRDLAEAFPEAAALFERADDVLGVPLRRICWEGPEEELTRTENAQPALLLHGYVVWSLLPEGLRASTTVAAGHSLGEFTAYLAAGALGLEDALRLVRRRGELMAASKEGTMAAVLGLDDEDVGAVCRETDGVVVPANFNAPGQVVVSGAADAVARAVRRAREAGAWRVIELDVSGAFHSPLMEVARDGLAEALREVEFRPPAFPVVANAAGRPVEDPEEARELLVEQLTSPVRWVAGVEAMRSRGPDRWLELGPGSVLAGLMRRIDRSLEVTSIGSAEDVDEIRREVEDG
ncbi:MAG: ACP S-malonyltransferase [Gemmatimonadota bacterium]